MGKCRAVENAYHSARKYKQRLDSNMNTKRSFIFTLSGSRVSCRKYVYIYTRPFSRMVRREIIVGSGVTALALVSASYVSSTEEDGRLAGVEPTCGSDCARL